MDAVHSIPVVRLFLNMVDDSRWRKRSPTPVLNKTLNFCLFTTTIKVGWMDSFVSSSISRDENFSSLRWHMDVW